MKKSLKFSKILLLTIFLIVSHSINAQDLKTNGKKIVDASGNEVILRGMGLGGWMIQEGYMMETNSFANPQHEIKAKIAALIGTENTDAFYKKWHQTHCTRADIDSLKSWGFNSVRLPMHYNLFTLPIEEEPVAGNQTWLTEGFALTDSLLKWCTENQMYLILDLHAAPGGQGKDAAISDYDPLKPSLWESEANKQKTIALWRKLAERYVNEPWIGGYDVINEPNWSFTAGGNQNGCSENSNIPLRNLYKDITTAIRQVDTKHIIIIEGNCWGNNYNGILPLWDNNMVLSFHKYWSYNDLGSIQGIMNLRNTYNVPIWCGESGENSNSWFTQAISLFEKNNIGWAWWPLKKVASVVNPLTIKKNDEYQVLLNYWSNGGTKPSADFAFNALMQLAENAKIENCIFRKDLIDAMFRQINSNTTIPYSEHKIPSTIQATDFDMGRNGFAYYDVDTANYHVSSGTYTAWNNGWNYRNDGVDIAESTDNDLLCNGHYVGWTENNEWMLYTVQVDSSASYKLEIRYSNASAPSSAIAFEMDGNIIAASGLPVTGLSTPWKTQVVNDVILYKGKHALKYLTENKGANVEYFKFTLQGNIADVDFKALNASTINESQLIGLFLNKQVLGSSVNLEGFTCFVNGTQVSLKSIVLQNGQQLIFSIDKVLSGNDVITLSYNGGKIQELDGAFLLNFSNLKVNNKMPSSHIIGGKIEAEDFSVNNGLQFETTTDVGGGQNAGFTNAGDYLEYKVQVKRTATYKVDVRAACFEKAGRIEMQQLDYNGQVLHSKTIEIPVTGGWQNWVTIKSEMPMDAGLSKLRVNILQPEFNLNWYNFVEIIKDTTTGNNHKSIRIFPNPAKDELTIEVPKSKGKANTLLIHSLNGALVKTETLQSGLETYKSNIGNLNRGFYIVELLMDGDSWRSKLLIE